jgi:hypothetical protein
MSYVDEGLVGPTTRPKSQGSYIIRAPMTTEGGVGWVGGRVGEQTRAVHSFYVHSLRFNNLIRPDCSKISSRRSRDQFNPSVTLKTEAVDKQKLLLAFILISLATAPSTQVRYIALRKYHLSE